MITKETDVSVGGLVWNVHSADFNPNTAKTKRKANQRKPTSSHPLKHLKLQDDTNINF